MTEPTKTCCCDLGADCPEAKHWCAVPDLFVGEDCGFLTWLCPECERPWETYRVDLDERAKNLFKVKVPTPTWGWRTVRL